MAATGCVLTQDGGKIVFTLIGQTGFVKCVGHVEDKQRFLTYSSIQAHHASPFQSACPLSGFCDSRVVTACDRFIRSFFPLKEQSIMNLHVCTAYVSVRSDLKCFHAQRASRSHMNEGALCTAQRRDNKITTHQVVCGTTTLPQLLRLT